MSFLQITYALAVHRYRHFSRAAESCGVTQATISEMISQLEEELGFDLFDRSRYPVRTTVLGRQFVEMAGKILEQRDRLLQLKDVSGQALRGDLVIGIIPTVASALLPLVLPTIVKDNPELRLKVREVTTEQIIRMLEEDKLDMGILATPLDYTFREEEVLYYESMMVYGVKDGARKFISSKAVKDANIWLLEEGHCFREQAMTLCQMRERERVTSGLDFAGGSFDTLIKLTDNFGGYTLIPELHYQGLPHNRKQRTRPFQRPFPVREISLVSLRSGMHVAAREYLTTLVQQTVSPLLTTTRCKSKDLDIIGI